MDIHVESARLQKAIEGLLGMSGQAIFDYQNENGHTYLHLITVNARHNQSFLYHKTEGTDKLDALQKMHAYVSKEERQGQTYTVQWQAKDDDEVHTSYFRAHSMYEALDKLFYGRDMHAIKVYSIVMNPES